MKNWLVFLFLGISFLACTDTTEEASENSEPATSASADTASFTTLQWEKIENSFGTIQQGEKVQIIFKFTNTGKNPLVISQVTAGCGCTVAEYTKEAVPPGGSGRVTAAFDSGQTSPGDIRKNIFVTANTLGGNFHTLTFTGFVKTNN
jgi:hypothetical protein